MKNSNFNDNVGFFETDEKMKTGNTVCRKVCNEKSIVELSTDITLPDYLPEIRKLLRVSVIPSSPSKYISVGAAQFSGGVDYSVCYIGADGEIYGASFPGEYSFNAPFIQDAEYDMNEGLTAISDIAVESAVSRVNSARKINVKTRMIANSEVLGATRVDEPSWLDEPIHFHTQKLVKEIAYCKEMVGSNDEIELHDKLSLDSDDVRYVCSECGIFIEEVKAGDGYVDCRGNVKIKYLLCKKGESLPFTVEKRLELEEIVEIDGIKPGMSCSAYCVCTGVDVVPDDDVEEMNCAVRLRIVARGFGEEHLKYVSDAYSTEYASCFETEKLTLPVMKSCINRNITFRSAVEIEKIIGGQEKTDITVVDSSVSVASANIGCVDEGCSIKGNVCFNIIFSTRGTNDDPEISSVDIELPFKMDGAPGISDSDQHSLSVGAFEPTVKITQNEVELGCEISAAFSSVGKVVLAAVSTATVGNEISDVKNGITVYYPSSEDSVWSVAKKHGVSVEEVASDNKIPSEVSLDSSDSLRNVKYLII